MWSNENSKYYTNSKLWSGPLKNVNRSQKKHQHENITRISTVVNDWYCVDTVLTLKS